MPVTLRVEPHMIPAVRAAFDDALNDIALQIFRIQREGVIPEPWLGDATSRGVFDHFHHVVIEASEGPYAALKAYEAELIKIRDALGQMEENYRRTEGENAALWGRA